MMEVLDGIVERALTAIVEMSDWVWSVVSQELLVIVLVVLVGMLGYQLVLRRR